MEEKKIEHWSEVKEKLQREYPQLTHDDLIYRIGQEEELLERLQKRLNKTKQEIRKWLHLMG